MATIPPQVVGFHYYSIVVDGSVVADPATRTFFGSGWDNSGIEIPESEADAAYYSARDVPHGQVSQRWYYSKVTGKWRRCYVYTPPEYDSQFAHPLPGSLSPSRLGRKRTGLAHAGPRRFHLDNLIAEKKAKPMIIVMDNLNAVKPGEEASLYAARGIIARPTMADVAPAGGGRGAPGGGRGGLAGNWGGVFTEMMFTDLIPMVERTYRVAPGRENRAMAGLSMGGMQSFRRCSRTSTSSPTWVDSAAAAAAVADSIPRPRITACSRIPAAFNKKMKVLFLGIGSVEGPGTKNFSEALTKAGIQTSISSRLARPTSG